MEIETIKKDVGMNWKSVDLVTVCDFQGGTQPPKSEWSSKKLNGFVRMIQIRDFTQGKDSFIEYVKDNNKLKKCTKDDIMIGRYGASIGKILTGIEGAYNVALVKTIPSSELDKRYFFHYLNTPYFQNFIQNAGSRAAQAGFNKEELKDLQIPLPPLATQKRIAEILDAADALKCKDQELLKKYDDLAQAIFIDMFGDPVKNEKGWEVSALEDLCIDIVDCPHTTPNHTQEITDFPCIRTSEMKNRKISWGSMKYLNKEEYSKRVKRLIPEAGDIVYAREGTYGQAVLLPENYHFALGQRTMLLRPNSNLVSNEFLWYQINSDFVYRQAKRKNMGSTVGHVNVADVKKFDILVPPVQLQLKFTNAIINLISAESLFENQESDKLFDSLIQKAFKGELVA
jgi:type I restriction enzyme S subunit